MNQLLYLITGIHLALCPFTKVEESFNMQAMHDILYHRHNLSLYDHNDFPGVVPRTFVGSLVISFISFPLVSLIQILGLNKFYAQYVVRLCLATCVIVTWSGFRRQLCRIFGGTFGWWFTLVTATQYHFMFYMTRALPNIITLPLVFLALDGWLSGNKKKFLISSGAGMIIFRSELALLFSMLLIYDLIVQRTDFYTVIKITVPAGLGLILLTVVVDSILWGRPVWPEAEVFWFNTIMNKSSQWGTSPFLWYFYSALPRGLGPSLLLVPIGLVLDKRTIPIAAPGILFVLLFSFLPHKELRFIIYVFPMINVATAATCNYIFTRRYKTQKGDIIFWMMAMCIAGNAFLSMCLLSVAINNYPGGAAMMRFHTLLQDEPYVHVHIDNLAAQTGVTRFTQLNDHWKYSKNESLTPEQLQTFTHLIIEAKSKYSPNLKPFTKTHIILDSIDMFSHVSISYRSIPPVRIKTKPALFILEKDNFRDYVDEIRAVNEEINVINEVNDEEKSEFKDEEDNMQDDAIILPPYDSVEDIKDGSPEVRQDDSTETIEEIPEEIFKELRRQRKENAIDKIKKVTKQRVIASAKQRLREFIARHKDKMNVASKEESDDLVNEREENDEVVNETVEEQVKMNMEFQNVMKENFKPDDIVDEVNQRDDSYEIETLADLAKEENVEIIVNEVVNRLIDRKIYKEPEEISQESRDKIHEIVEEVVTEKLSQAKRKNEIEFAPKDVRK